MSRQRRLRTYRVHAMGSRGDHPWSRPSPLHPYTVTVRAVSIRQAYWLAAHGVRATGPGAVGVVRVVHVDRSAGERTLVWEAAA